MFVYTGNVEYLLSEHISDHHEAGVTPTVVWALLADAAKLSNRVCLILNDWGGGATEDMERTHDLLRERV